MDVPTGWLYDNTGLNTEFDSMDCGDNCLLDFASSQLELASTLFHIKADNLFYKPIQLQPKLFHSTLRHKLFAMADLMFYIKQRVAIQVALPSLALVQSAAFSRTVGRARWLRYFRIRVYRTT